jgi:hypothetical protein
MLVRAIALSLAILVSIGVIIPLATETTEAGPRTHRRKHVSKYKKYSKGWWRQYRARMKRKRSLTARKRALRLQQLRLAKAAETTNAQGENPMASVRPVKAVKGVVLPSGDKAPDSWKAAQATSAELQFRVDNSSGEQVGSASISVVGPAVSGADSGRRSVGGVATSTLRREVIDRMIRENGWVVNDYQKDIAGQAVYVVEAQSQAKSGAVQSRRFYFTEVDGRIYSVATNSPVQESERLAEESEKVINSLKSRVRPTLRASN